MITEIDYNRWFDELKTQEGYDTALNIIKMEINE